MQDPAQIKSCNECGFYLPEDYDGSEDGRGLTHYSPTCSKAGKYFPDSHKGELPPWCPLKRQQEEERDDP